MEADGLDTLAALNLTERHAAAAEASCAAAAEASCAVDA